MPQTGKVKGHWGKHLISTSGQACTHVHKHKEDKGKEGLSQAGASLSFILRADVPPFLLRKQYSRKNPRDKAGEDCAGRESQDAGILRARWKLLITQASQLPQQYEELGVKGSCPDFSSGLRVHIACNFVTGLFFFNC